MQGYCLDSALAGNKIPGYKLVEGRSNRKFTDADAVKDKLLAEGYKEADILRPQELVTLGDLEKKIVGKKQFGILLKDFVVKPPGKPALVPETDNRPEWRSLEVRILKIWRI